MLSLGATSTAATAALPSPLPASITRQPPLPPPTGTGVAGASFALALFPGQVIQPIDLANVLRLAGARSPDIAIARQRVFQAVADLGAAQALWLPSLFIGPTYYRADGQVQTITGQVQNVARCSQSTLRRKETSGRALVRVRRPAHNKNVRAPRNKGGYSKRHRKPCQ